MEQEFPYLKIKPNLLKVVGPPDEDTRIFRQSGIQMSFHSWMFNLQDEMKGNLIPSNWVPEFVGVSRAAVHKRIKAGRLTMFVFDLMDHKLTVLMKYKEVRICDFSYCVRSECFAWYEEIMFRNARKGPPELFN